MTGNTRGTMQAAWYERMGPAREVLSLGKHKQQGIREEVETATAAIRASGKSI